MHPRIYAKSHADKAALTMDGTGRTVTYGELESLANQGAQFLRKSGIENGDVIALWAPNSIEFMTVYWAAQRAGVYICPLPTHLSVEDADYILKDCGAKMLILSSAIASANAFISEHQSASADPLQICSLHTESSGLPQWEACLEDMPDTPIADEQAGWHLIYSSGTTGRPKGVKLPFIGGPVVEDNVWAKRYESTYGLTDKSVFLTCAPLYHAAPMLFASNVMRRGAGVVIMKKFDAEKTLAAIQNHRITMSQMVPTMFIRMLNLPEATRLSYDVSSLEIVAHAAAPCPIEIKYKMLDWFGDIIDEYYAGSESNGATLINSAEWRKKPGSVGRSKNAVVRICSEAGDELPAGDIGTIYFDGGYEFEYLNDPEKTRAARNPKHPTWTTLGDIGYLDEDGYLFLTDRKHFVIISGGVNIYPQEAENTLIQHPKVQDVAVFGIPNSDMGEEVKAVVQPMDWKDVGASFEAELIAYCRSKLTHYKCPKSIDFEEQLPRHDNGKLYKKQLRAKYWPERVNA